LLLAATISLSENAGASGLPVLDRERTREFQSNRPASLLAKGFRPETAWARERISASDRPYSARLKVG
jgi:hypothetical protein